MFKRLLKDLAGNRASANTSGNREDFLPLYDSKFGPLLGVRETGFRVIFELLQNNWRAHGNQTLIVETGSLREVGNWAGDGQSTVLWKEFSQLLPCEIHTVDLNPATSEIVRSICGDAVNVHTGDSVAFLHRMATMPSPRQIDLLYLDSYDFDPDNPFPSSFHHIKELIAVRPCLGPGSIIAIDDNFQTPEGKIIGKGSLAMEWFDHLGIPFKHMGYQFVWQL